MSRAPGPWSPMSEETLTCSSAPASRCLSSRSSEPGGALGVRQQQSVAEVGQARHGGVEHVVEAAERALEQQPRRVRGALGDQRELVVVELQRVLVGELAAGVQAHLEAVGVERALGRRATVGELVQRDVREVGALDVRRAGHVAHALGVQPAGEPAGLLHRPGAVVEAREEMRMQIHVSHCP